MKIKNIFSGMMALAAVALTGCDSEKDLIIIEGQLPIKSSTLYMVGDATPNGWSIDSPTPFTQSEADPMVFTWEGALFTGEMKLCLVPGSWDVGFIRPVEHGTEISSTDITDQTFDMHAGDPDNKWRVAEAGQYRLSFNLRDWTYSTTYLGSGPAPEIEPIKTETLYICGNATPTGWNIDAPTQLEKKSEYIFVFEGDLVYGEMKACLAPGSFDVDFIRPAADGTEINKEGAAQPGFVFTANPDHKWLVTEAGKYRLTFDLENWTINAEYLAAPPVVDKTPLDAPTLFMIGDATPGGWSLDNATPLTREGDTFVWEGTLAEGEMKACISPDSFDVPFVRPAIADCKISPDGVESPDFVYTTGPDDKWKVTAAGNYRLVFDLVNWTLTASKID